jgi:hypothetical protein
MSDNEELFDRRARLTIKSPGQVLYAETFNVEQQVGDTGIIITDMAMEFDIEHNLTKHPNQCLVKVMNLSETTRKAISRDGRPLTMVLEAGYKDKISVIFSGDITYALSTQKGADWVTEIQGGDGDRYNSHARVNRSYAPGTKVGTVIEDLLNDVQQHVPDVVRNSEIFQKTLNSGIALVGKQKDALAKVLGPYGYSMSVQDGKPVILRSDDTTGDVYEVSERKGMIDSPEFGRPDRKTRLPNVTIKSLLYPELRAGASANVIARDLSGTFKITKVKHVGQTHGPSWFTEIEVKPTKSGQSTQTKTKTPSGNAKVGS